MKNFIEVKMVGDDYVALNLNEKFSFFLQNGNLIKLDRNLLNL